VLTDVRVGGKALPGGRFNGSPATPPLTVYPGANRLAIEFSALDYSAPDRLSYAYMLEGYDAALIEVDPTRRLAAYTNLSPGDYTLRLRGSNRSGTAADIERSVPIRVIGAWNQTP